MKLPALPIGRPLVATLLAATLALVSHAADAPAVSGDGTVEQPSVESALVEETWQLVRIQSMDDTESIPDDRSRYTLRLEADGTVQVLADCNRATGSWTSEQPGSLRFGPLAATMAQCPPASLHDRYLAQFPWVRSYVMKDGHLFLAAMADGSILELEPADADADASAIPRPPEEGGPLDWQVAGVATGLRLRDAPSVAADVLATFPAGAILDNLGCREAEGRVWCDVQPLGGGPRGFVAAEYLIPARSPNGAPIMGPDDSATRAGAGDFDASGQVPCAQHRGQPLTSCAFQVARTGGGYATVVVSRPDGRTRMLYFRMGLPIGADTSQADGYPPFSATKEGDLHRISVGEERYEIPDAVPLGG